MCSTRRLYEFALKNVSGFSPAAEVIIAADQITGVYFQRTEEIRESELRYLNDLELDLSL